MRFSKFLLVAVIALAVGCGEHEVSERVTPAGPPPVKAMLEGVATSGELGSGAQEIREAITKLQATDQAKGATLLADMNQLEKMTNPAQIKAKAKEMANKL